ncbi:MAG: C4-dicarboxylate TRAP transporter substrate-binding protein [Pseudomonadota bacterium]
MAAIKLHTATGLSILAATGVLCTAPVSLAQETIALTAIDGYPPRSMWVREFIEFYIPEVDRRLAENGNYEIDWNQAWGGQIVRPRGVLEGLELGLGDIGVVTTVFHPDRLPLAQIAYVTPFVSTDPELVTRAIDELAAQFPEVAEAYLDANQIYLTNGVVLDSYQVFSTDPIDDLDDLDGIRMGGAGTNLRYVENLGAAGVSGPLVEYYNNLQTGVIDATMLWPEAAVTFSLVEVAPYMLDADIGTVNSKAVAVNRDVWEGLPEEVQQVLQEVAIDYRNHVAAVAADLGAGSEQAYADAGGTIHQLSAEERAEWAASMPNLALEWAANLDEQGLPGTEMLQAYMDMMREADQPIARQWDQE